MALDDLQLHIEARVADGARYGYIETRTIFLTSAAMLRVLGLTRSPGPATVLERVPDDVSDAASARIATLKTIKRVSTMDRAALECMKWEQGPTRNGFVDAKQYANILKGNAVTAWCKGVLGADVVDNDEMARRIANGTATFKTMTRAQWKEPLKESVRFLYDIFLEHFEGQRGRRLLSVLGRR